MESRKRRFRAPIDGSVGNRNWIFEDILAGVRWGTAGSCGCETESPKCQPG